MWARSIPAHNHRDNISTYRRDAERFHERFQEFKGNTVRDNKRNNRLRFERKKGSNNETVTQSPLQPSIAPLFPPSCLVNRIKRGPSSPPPPSLFPFSGKERRVGGEAFRSRAFAFASGWRTVKNKDPFVRIGVERGGLRLVSKGEKVFRRERERRKRRQCNGRKKPCGRRMG